MSIKKIIFILLPVFLLAPFVAAKKPIDISLRIEPDYVSPNNDGLNDLMFFYPVLPSGVSVTRWRLDIVDAKKRRVQRLSGAGVSALIQWDVKDKNDETLSDGVYSVTFEAWTRGGHFKAAAQSFTVDTITPSVEIGISTAGIADANSSIIVTPDVHDDSPIDRWQFQVINQLGKTVDVQWSTESVHPINWLGRDRSTGVMFPRGMYTGVYQVWDKAGNESDPLNLQLKIEAAPSETLRELLTHIMVYETSIGLVTPLPQRDILVKKKNKWVLTERADAMLKEVALLINSYPDNPVRLDGYFRIKKGAEKSRDMSSVYAWTVFSHLVKKGNVKASRLIVRGRGKSPMFDRRSVQPEVLTDGVEVIIEGNQKW